MLRDELRARAKTAPADGRGHGVDDAVVEADERQMGLGDRDVVVVAHVRDDRFPALRRRAPRAAR